MLFLTIISVASCLVLSSASIPGGGGEDAARDSALAYARASLDSLLASTLSEAFYVGDGGKVVLGNNTTVEEYLLVETYLISRGTAVASFDHCNGRIEAIARALLTGAYEFSISASLAGERGFETVFSLGAPRSSPSYSASSDYSLYGDSIRIGLILYWA